MVDKRTGVFGGAAKGEEATKEGTTDATIDRSWEAIWDKSMEGGAGSGTD